MQHSEERPKFNFFLVDNISLNFLLNILFMTFCLLISYFLDSFSLFLYNHHNEIRKQSLSF